MRGRTIPIVMRVLLSLSAASIISSSRVTADVPGGVEERSETIERLRKASLACSASWAYPSETLVEIGNAQCMIGDLDGAFITLNAIPPQERDSWPVILFVEQLVAAQAAAGDSKKAFQTVDVIPWRRPGLGQCGIWLALAKAANTHGNAEAALHAINLATAVRGKIPADERRQILLHHIALTQFEIGQHDGGAETLQQMVVLTRRIVEDPGEDPQTRSYALRRLGEVYAKAGNQEGTQQSFDLAVAAIESDHPVAAGAYHRIAVARAKAGDLEASLRLAKSISGTWGTQHKALHDIVLIVLKDGKRREAERVASFIRSNAPQYYNGAHLEICRSHARAGSLDEAFATASRITTESRRAQAVLDVCSIMARQGKNTEARRITEGLTGPSTDWPPMAGDKGDTLFDFTNHLTWGLLYTHDHFTTTIARHHVELAAGDLTAAAMRCRVALEGDARITYSAKLEEWDVRKASRAQACAGDARGALVWINGLTERKQVAALIGVAEGLSVKE